MIDAVGIGELRGAEHICFVITLPRDAIGELAESGTTDFTPVPMGGNPDEEARTMDVLKAAM
jgi:hypothetical protein